MGSLFNQMLTHWIVCHYIDFLWNLTPVWLVNQLSDASPLSHYDVNSLISWIWLYSDSTLVNYLLMYIFFNDYRTIQFWFQRVDHHFGLPVVEIIIWGFILGKCSVWSFLSTNTLLPLMSLSETHVQIHIL